MLSYQLPKCAWNIAAKMASMTNIDPTIQHISPLRPWTCSMP